MLAFTAAVIWSFNFIAIKAAREQVGAVTLMIVRFDVAVLLILLVWAVRRPTLRGIRPTSWALIAGVAVLAGPGFHLLLNHGAAGTSTGLIAMIVATQSLHVAWAGALFLREKLNGKQGLALAVAFGGIALPLLVDGDVSFVAPVYPLMIAAGAVLASSNVILPRILTAHVNAIDLACLVLLLAALLCQPLMSGTVIAEARGMDGRAWLATVYLGTVGMVGVLPIWYAALRRLPAVTTGFYLFVMMIGSIVWGALLRGEAVTWTYIAASLAVLVGIYLNATAGVIHRKPVMMD